MSPARQDTTPLDYTRARLELNTGDVALFRARPWKLDPRSWRGALIGSLITWFGRSDYSHAGMLIPVRGVWFVGEMIEGVGGRLWPLAKYAESHSGEIDIFRPADPRYKPGVAASEMLGFVGTPYGWRSLLKAFALHLPFVRHLARARSRSGPWRGPLFCSGAVALAMELAGSDPVGDLPPEHTEPGDLARSPIINRGYLFTIKADAKTDGPAPRPDIREPFSIFSFEG